MITWTGRDISLPSPEANLLLDEVLLEKAEEEGKGHILRFWEPSSVFIVMGRISPKEDIAWPAVIRDKVPVYRRVSGGGTVVQAPGCLNYTLIVPRDSDPALNDIRRGYRIFLKHVQDALRRLGWDTEIQGISDLAVVPDQRKVSGNAQRRLRRMILHHGTLLCGMDITLISRYLTLPRERPEYRRDRPHDRFVKNLNCSAQEIKEAFKDTFPVQRLERTLAPEEQRRLTEKLARFPGPVWEPGTHFPDNPTT